MDCGCQIDIGFHVEKVGRRAAWTLGESAYAVAHIEREPCEDHGGAEWDAPKAWNGALIAWAHDPKRPDKFEPG